MTSDQIATSAALYFKSGNDDSIPLLWLERVRGWFADFDLSPVLFTAGGGDFLLDDCYVLAEAGHDLVRWGEMLPARGSDLVESLHNGLITTIGVDSPRSNGADRQDWRAAASVSASPGEMYVGIDEEFVPNPSELLRIACRFAKGIFKIQYGIGYKSPLSQNPECYASGFEAGPRMDVFHLFRTEQNKTPVERWRDELNGQQRHLAGLFRGAYPASILSESHLQTVALKSHGIGRLTALDASRWLWELSESEMPGAEAFLESHGALIGAPIR